MNKKQIEHNNNKNSIKRVRVCQNPCNDIEKLEYFDVNVDVSLFFIYEMLYL